MPSDSLDQLLDRLDEARRNFDANGARVEKLLAALARRNFPDPESLIRFHEALLFIRAYPQSPEALVQAESALDSFADRVEQLRLSGVDLTPFDYIEYSGIAGTTLHGAYSYGIARWLVAKHPTKVEVDWERIEKKERLGVILPRLIPLLYEDALVEANVPYLTWIRAAKTRKTSDLAWLVESFDRAELSEKEKSALYDSLELWIRWEMGRSQASRTFNRRKPRQVFYHTGPLIRRSDVSLAKEIKSPLALVKLSRAEGEAILSMCRDTTCVRYRELYGIAYGDPSSVVRSSVGRGTEIFLWGLPPERRLPLRAYHAGFTLKNGVPINYIEGISIFERMELGFNTFYTYRDGETAWVYAQALRALHQLTGATCFSIDTRAGRAELTRASELLNDLEDAWLGDEFNRVSTKYEEQIVFTDDNRLVFDGNQLPRWQEAKRTLEGFLLRNALRQTNNSLTRAARKLGVSKVHVHNLKKKHNL